MSERDTNALSQRAAKPQIYISTESMLDSIDIIKLLDLQLSAPHHNHQLKNTAAYGPVQELNRSSSTCRASNCSMVDLQYDESTRLKEIRRLSLQHTLGSRSSYNYYNDGYYPAKSSRFGTPLLSPISPNIDSDLVQSEIKALKKQKLLLPDAAFRLVETELGPEYHCAHPGCKKVYTSRSSNAKSHWMAHKGIMPYHCTFCSKRFTRNYDCVRHINTIHKQP
jgi:hypothetical protein